MRAGKRRRWRRGSVNVRREVRRISNQGLGIFDWLV